MTSNSIKSLYLVDDEVTILTPLSLFLKTEGYEVQSFTSGFDFWEVFEKKRPDLAILDIKMPKMDGLELLGKIRKQEPFLPVIFLTSKDEEIDEVVGFRMGADDYITKPFSQRLVLERIKALLRRSKQGHDNHSPDFSEEKLMVRGALSLDPERHFCSWNGQALDLTVTEFLILQCLASHPGHVKSRDALMDAAYGDNIYVDDRTIDSHIKRLRKKLKDADQEFDAIDTLYGVGYRYSVK